MCDNVFAKSYFVCSAFFVLEIELICVTQHEDV